MSFFEDMSIYSYKENQKNTPLNIGWLDKSYHYKQGNVDSKVTEKILKLTSVKLMMTRGFHVCNLCISAKNSPLIVKYGDEELKLGFAEIRVFGKENKIYAAPNLIYHYIKEHNYQPPDEFIEAVLNGPDPYSNEYNELLRINNLA
jgi:hypothetical protein